MKNILKKAIAVAAVAMVLVSCSKSDDAITGTGALKVEFENGFADNALILESATVSTSQNEVLKISSIKYIVSNIVLTKEDGTTFTYPKSQIYFIVDEAQNIKNPDTAQTLAIKMLKADVKVAMTGTPVENRLTELWSIFDFINKGYLGSLKEFQKSYAIPIERFNPF